jgi:site-specific recombinase XerD
MPPMAALRHKKGGKNKMTGAAMVCFEEASKSWLKWAQARKRKPMRVTSVPTIKSALSKWIIPHVGALPLDKVHNGTCKPLVKAMQDAELSSRTQNMYLGIVKQVVASVTDDETGEPIVVRKWNPAAMDLPVIEHQKTPCFTSEQLEKILAPLPERGWERTLYVLLASSGLRISEALALDRIEVVEELERVLDSREGVPWTMTLTVNKQVSRYGKIVQYTKTKAGVRQVDLHSSVTRVLTKYVGMGQEGRKRGNKGELLFPTRRGTAQLPRNLLRVLKKRTSHGFHSFRRFRNTVLSEQNCNRDAEVYWMGHSPHSMSELYSKLAKKTDFRLAEAERIGVGFDPTVKQIVKSQK